MRDVMSDYLTDMFGLVGRTAVVTGGAGTLGGAIATAYVRAGARVVLWDHAADRLERRAQTIASSCGEGSQVDTLTTDLLDEADVERAVAETRERVGRFHILVNACGGNRGKAALAETSLVDFRAVLELNLVAGCMLPSKHVARLWVANDTNGSIINIASMTATCPLSGVIAYSAAKAGVVNLTQSMARELAPHGIRVNALSPGFFLADQNRALLVDRSTGELTDRGRQIVTRTPYRRFGEPDELAGACLLLASDRAGSFITGTVLTVDGGYLVDNV
jgi:NAD(P)-dependent dehydrogenase (short-subunit alcohol dehydrogenase family)